MARGPLIRIPELAEACPQWAESADGWGMELPEGATRLRTLGQRRVFERVKGRSKSGIVVGVGAPAVPTVGDLLRRAKSLCERSILVRDDEGVRHAVQNSRVRELNRTPRPTDEGLRISALEARQVVANARNYLAVGDVLSSDYERGGTLPYPHRAGSSPCSGTRRPAAVLRDLEAWREGEAHDSWTAEDALARAREMDPAVADLDDVVARAKAIEERCLDVWARWVDKAERSRKQAIRDDAAALRTSYRTSRRGKATVRIDR